MSGQSPLKAKPLRLPGESVDKEIDRWINDATLGPFFGAGSFCIVAFFEWYGYLTHSAAANSIYGSGCGRSFVCGMAPFLSSVSEFGS
jgi:hypothetical protein